MSEHDADLRMWLTIRRALLSICKAIALRYGIEDVEDRRTAS